MKNKTKKFSLSYIIFLTFLTLNILGIFMIYSSTYKSLISVNRNGFSHFFEQVVYFIIVLGLGIFILNYNKKFKIQEKFNKYIDVVFWITIVSLLLVLTPLGSSAGGARSVIRLGIDYQPVELYKIIMIFYFAKYISNVEKLTTKDYILNLLIIPGIGIGLTILEPDFGGVILLGVLLLSLLILYKKKLNILLKILGVFLVIGLIGGIFFLVVKGGNGYQIDRITAWINPFDPTVRPKNGNNMIQSYVSISNGGIFGLGYTNSIQKTGFLFAPSTDFIFSIICEELGIWGALITIILLFALAIEIFLVGKKSNKIFEYFYCAGFAILILLQSFINIGGVIGVIPMTGVTLPFISKGLNSYMILSLALIYVLLIEDQNKRERKKQERLNL